MSANIVVSTIEVTPRRLTTNKFKYKAQVTGNGKLAPGETLCTYDTVRIWCTKRLGASNATYRVNVDAQWAWDSSNRSLYFNDGAAFTAFMLSKSKFEF